MEKEFKEMLMKRMKEQGKVDPKKLEAKASMMKELSNMLGTDMKDSISHGMNKVTVASDSPEGLETGLDLAKKKLNSEDMLEEPEMEEDSENYSDDMPEEEESEDDELAMLEKKIAELKAKKLK